MQRIRPLRQQGVFWTDAVAGGGAGTACKPLQLKLDSSGHGGADFSPITSELISEKGTAAKNVAAVPVTGGVQVKLKMDLQFIHHPSHAIAEAVGNRKELDQRL